MTEAGPTHRPSTHDSARRFRSSRPSPAMPRDIYVLSLVAVIVALGFGIVGPAIPLLAADFGVGKTAAATAVSAFALCRLASALANGVLVERLGARRVLACGLVLQAVTTFVAGLAPSFAWVVILRSVGGIGSAAFTVAAMSLLLRTALPTQRGRATSMFQGGFMVGAIVGPAAGGFLTAIEPRVPFLVYGAILTVAAVVGMLLLSRQPTLPPDDANDLDGASDDALRAEALLAEHADEGGAAAPRTTTSRGAADRRALTRAFAACLVANLGVGWMLYGVRSSLMPIYVVEELGRSAVWAGSAFLVGSVAQVIVLLRAGRIVDTWGRRPAMLLGSGVMTAAVLALALLPPNLGVFLGAMAVLGVSGAFLGCAPAAVLADISGGRPGKRVAIFQMFSDGGAVVGPLVSGLLVDVFSYSVAFISGAVVLGVGLLGALLMPETLVPARASRRR
ncbi:MFS transporter [Pseudonocardia yunnanensis]